MTEENAIDEKKTEETGPTNSSAKLKNFASDYTYSIFITIGILIFIIGTLGLYTTKVAQSNILPDNIGLAPYTNLDRVLKDINVDLNIMRPTILSDYNKCFSQKAVFNSQEYLDSFKNGFLCYLKKNADPTKGAFANAPLFFSYVYDSIVSANFIAINSIFLYLSYLPEWLIMMFYGFFGIFIWVGLYFFNMIISIFYHFINIPQLFRMPAEDDKKWEANKNISFFHITKLLLFFFLWIPVGLMSTFMMPLFFTIYGLISPLFASYKINGSKSFNVFDFIKDTFVYKKYFFFILATLSLLNNGIKAFGNSSLIVIIIAIIFAYIMGLYNNEMPENGVDGFTAGIKENIKQATINVEKSRIIRKKICKQVPVNEEIYGGDIELSTMNSQEQEQPTQEQQPVQSRTNENNIKPFQFSKYYSSQPRTNGNNVKPPPVYEPYEQLGGKTKKPKNYNIRLV